MTNQEAIEQLKNARDQLADEQAEQANLDAIDFAIKALERLIALDGFISI